MIGKKHTEETKLKMSKNWRNAHYWKGKKHSMETRKKMSLNKRKEFCGAYYHEKAINPWRKVWASKIRVGKRIQFLGLFHDPLSASLVYQLVWDAIHEIRCK